MVSIWTLCLTTRQFNSDRSIRAGRDDHYLNACFDKHFSRKGLLNSKKPKIRLARQSRICYEVDFCSGKPGELCRSGRWLVFKLLYFHSIHITFWFSFEFHVLLVFEFSRYCTAIVVTGKYAYQFSAGKYDSICIEAAWSALIHVIGFCSAGSGTWLWCYGLAGKLLQLSSWSKR